MARRRFFVPEIRRDMAELTGADAEHLVRVLRAEVGQQYEISDNQQVFLAQVEVARKSVVTFRCLEEIPLVAPSVHITLFVALIKFDHFEWMIEKTTELGVETIQPVETVRTEHGLAQAAHKRLARWEKIALESSQQSRRARLPEILEPVRLTNALLTSVPVGLCLDENPDATPLLASLPAERQSGEHMALLVGPEGGWTEDERRTMHQAGWKSCSLGPTILRTETAAIAAIAAVNAAFALTI